MTIDREKLKALAEAVNRGWYKAGASGIQMLSSREQEYVAAASPATVLELLAEIERLAPFEEAYATACSVRNRLIKEKDQLDQLVVANKVVSDSFKAERDQLKAENEALRKDAENWQTVRRAMDQLKSDEQGAAIWSACSRILISLVSDLNSARSVVTEEGVTKDGAEIGDWRVTVERLAMAKEANHG